MAQNVLHVQHRRSNTALKDIHLQRAESYSLSGKFVTYINEALLHPIKPFRRLFMVLNG